MEGEKERERWRRIAACFLVLNEYGQEKLAGWAHTISCVEEYRKGYETKEAQIIRFPGATAPEPFANFKAEAGEAR